ncbi:helix-turn-helix domain-containing protein [Selenomonadales bacterium OttesenSCG-928-I06]|nr:helix-turn-helix domain-containing protein [Selenomonadales bacterium OttesenSCG-928-I06]
MNFGNIIKKNREERKMSQGSLADVIRSKYNVRVSAAYISMIELNVRTNLTINLIDALLDYFDLTVEDAAGLFSASAKKVSYDKKPVPNYVFEKETNYDAEDVCTESDLEYMLQNNELSKESKKELQDFYEFLLQKDKQKSRNIKY